MAARRKKKRVFFTVNICTCDHGKDLHKGKCGVKGCNCTGFRFKKSVNLSKEVIE